MNIRTRFVLGALVASVLATAVPLSANAVSMPIEAVEFTVDAPAFISDAKMNEYSRGSVSFVEPDADVQAEASLACTLDIGDVYMRTSGSIHKFGTVGAKPKTSCSGRVTRIEQSTGVYKKTSGGWAQVAGDWNSFNTNESSLTQKNIEYVCKGQQGNDYRVVTRGAVWFPGRAPVPGGAYEISNGKLPCS